MSWDRTGQRLEAFHLKEYVVTGTVLESRVKYGGTVQHTLELETPVKIYGDTRTTLLINEPEVLGKLPVA